MYNIQINASLIDHNKRITIHAANWQVLANGEGHFILSNKATNDQLFHFVLSVCRHEIDSLPQQFEVAYRKVLSGMNRLQAYLLQRSQVSFTESEQIKFRLMLDSICSSKVDKIRVFLSKNLMKEDRRWDFYLQFKPKTPLPDIYSQEFISVFCEKNNIDKDLLNKILKNSPPEQKVRWFKKNALKSKKKNMNPLKIFGFTNSDSANYCWPMNLSTQKEVDHQLCNRLIQEFLNQTHVLEDIVRLQMLHLYQSDFRWVDLQNLDKFGENNEQISEKLLKEILKIQKPIMLAQKLHKQAPFLPFSNEQMSQFEKILRFLISWSWRDVSVIIRFNLSKESDKIQEVDLKVIDYEIKQAKKLHSTIQKDQQYLNNYVAFKKSKGLSLQKSRESE